MATAANPSARFISATFIRSMTATAALSSEVDKLSSSRFTTCIRRNAGSDPNFN